MKETISVIEYEYATCSNDNEYIIHMCYTYDNEYITHMCYTYIRTRNLHV